MNKILYLFGFTMLLLFPFIQGNSQTIINAYAKVSSISGATITVTNVDETYDTFEVGGQVFVMQMQDDVIGTNTGDNSNFGDLSNIQNAGVYQAYIISAVDRSSGPLTSITFTSSTNLSSFNTGTNSSVQVISYPKLGNGSDYTTTSDLTCLAWDGNIGGVLAFNVNGNLYLQNNISVDGKGFRGGAIDNNSSSGSCDDATYRIATNDHYAFKGEGIYKATDASFVAARGKILSGGGGGNSHNGGGAGGSNASDGGAGGWGWNCNPSAGGIGGIDLSSYINAARVFMGGGGGAGEGNNYKATAGGNGGGIILIDVDSIVTSSSCSGVSITANGNAALSTGSGGNDGAGAGGAGGSIIFDIDGYRIHSNCPLSITANGGNGGSVVDNAEHGGGGGGGMGAIIFSSAAPTTNVNIETSPGTGGSSGGSNSHPADNGTGTIGGNDAVNENDNTGPLPISLLGFSVERIELGALLKWQTVSEITNMGFDVQKSIDGKSWNRIDFVYGNGNSNELIEYSFIDKYPYKTITYYRLKQIDYDGTTSYYGPVVLQNTAQKEFDFHIAPNPANDLIYIQHNIGYAYTLNIYTSNGYLLRSYEMNAETNSLSVSDLSIGSYIIEVKNGNFIKHLRLLIVR